MNYMQVPLGVNHVPQFLRAPTASGLRRLMALNNVKHKAFIVYRDFQFVASEKKWYVWFDITENLEELEKTLTAKEPEDS